MLDRAKLPRPEMPGNMQQVTKERFFDCLRADKRDIMPHTTHQTFTEWTTRDRGAWGWSSPGWRNTGAYPTIYAVLKERA